MSLYLTLFLRGFVIVSLTSANVSFIARQHWLAAFVTGYGISHTWWWNSKHAARDDERWAGFCYAAGAATGTVAGMALARLW